MKYNNIKTVRGIQSILHGLQQNKTFALYDHLRINPKLREPGIRLIISPPQTADSIAFRGGTYAEYHYEEVTAVLQDKQERVSSPARTISVQPDGLAVEAAICHELKHDIFYAIFGFSQREQFYAVVSESLQGYYLPMSTKQFWATFQIIPLEKILLTAFYHVTEPNCNPLSDNLLNRHAFAAELFAHLGMEFLGYPANSVTGHSWLNGAIPPPLTNYFRNLNLSSLDSAKWQAAIDLRVSLTDTRSKEKSQQLLQQLNALYKRPQLF